MSTDLTGLSPLDCPYDCNAERCVITGVNVCGHPFKGGLQGALQARPDVVTRFNQARKILHNKKVDLTGENAPEPAKPRKAARQRKKSSARKKQAPPAPEVSANPD